MTDLESWINYGDEMRRPLLITPELANSSKVVIVGGGLSGMCIAFRLSRKRPDLEIILLEQKDSLGGVISTWKEDEWICDLAVNATRPHPSFWRLVADLGLSDSFKPSNKDAKSRWILLDNKKHRLSFFTIFKLGLFKTLKSIKSSRIGGFSVAQLIPNKQIADALTLGIVNDTAENVDADFLMPSMTNFGSNPPIKKSKINKKILQTYPIFTPRKGSIASLEGGMETLTRAIEKELLESKNVTIKFNQTAQSFNSVSSEFDVPESSIIWSAPGFQDGYEFTELSIFAIGYNEKEVSNVKFGYGTLIPDRNIPISGILNESDLHHSKRCPNGHRLFRLMVPHDRWDGNEESVLLHAKKLLADKYVLFSKIGERKIPSYKPGYMSEISNFGNDRNLVGWSVSGVSITHVVCEAERIAELF
ncbi:MAG: FAD-dependent oxidoreductase [Euryarchaeota archaeon TMED248]|nr:MAG: FAD-dependent oxidoreductase [Euryarchaeota archaeon TMED248]|tara:strand:+ start:3617 stop:4873 length:1257 start_codon:yes stop_codon:yes gene_type:complete